MNIHIITGLPGSGKTSISRLIAEKEDSLIVNTDELRDKLFGCASDSTASGDFTQDQLDLIYKVTEVTTHYLLLSKPGVKHLVFEGTFRLKAQRQGIVDIARKLSSNANVLYVYAEDEIVKMRITNRFNNGVQKADFNTYLSVENAYETPQSAFEIDNSGDENSLNILIDNYLSILNDPKEA